MYRKVPIKKDDLVSEALGWESRDLSSLLSFATDLLSNFGQVISLGGQKGCGVFWSWLGIFQ